MPPGQRNLRLALLAAHHMLLAHGEAMTALRSEMGPDGEAGIVLNLAPCQPAGDSNADLEAAERFDGYMNRWFLDALYRGEYPEDMVRLYGDACPRLPRATWRSSPNRPTCSASTTTSGRSSGVRPRGAAASGAHA